MPDAPPDAPPGAPAAGPGAATRLIDGQRGHLFLWSPVCFAAGIALWFALRHEPAVHHYAAAACAAAAAGLAGAAMGGAARPALWAVALVLAGGLVAGARAHVVAGPVLDFRYYGPVEGRVVKVDRSGSDKLRVTLDRVRLPRMRGPPPERVRLSLHWDGPQAVPRAGRRVAATAHLSPPMGPAEPGGFDFRRHAFFARIGAIGYTRAPLILLAEPAPREAPVGRARAAVSDALRARIPGEAGDIAAAIVTGDRSGVDPATADALRRSNLAHLLAISGLHMGLVTGTVFAALRLGCAMAWPRAPGRRIAALGALGAGAGYLALSGGAVATERAFVMAAVVLGAVLLGRRALTMRGVAVAAFVVLVLRPEALTGPGLAMSFAATAALVAAFGAVRGVRVPGGGAGRFVAALILSSLVGGLATAPIAAAAFNQVPHYGLPANMLAVPIMSGAVMPLAVAAAALAPVGLEGVPLRVMGLGIDAILAIARFFAERPGAVSHLPTPEALAVPAYGLGLATLCIARGRLRLAAALPLALAAASWAGGGRPDVLIDGGGGLVGVLGPEGRALSRETGAGFVARIWLEDDGDPVPQPVAHARGAGPWGDVVLHLPGKGGLARAGALCRRGRILVLNVEPEAPLGGGCEALPPSALRRTGAIALRGTPEVHRRRIANDGCRLWACAR